MKLGLGLSLSSVGGTAGGSASLALPEGFVHRYEFSDAGNYTLSTSDLASATDLGSELSDLDTSTGGDQPTISTINSIGAANFDGGDLIYSDAAASEFSVTDGVFTIAVAFKLSGVASEQAIVSLSSVASFTVPRFYIGPLSSKWHVKVIGNLTSPNIDVSSAADADTNPHVMICRMNGTTVDMWIDGTQVITAQGVDVDARDWGRITLGALKRTSGTPSVYMTGQIGEVVAYGSALDASDVTAATDFLMDKWGIT